MLYLSWYIFVIYHNFSWSIFVIYHCICLLPYRRSQVPWRCWILLYPYIIQNTSSVWIIYRMKPRSPSSVTLRWVIVCFLWWVIVCFCATRFFCASSVFQHMLETQGLWATRMFVFTFQLNKGARLPDCHIS